jgi:hypothetical protein
MKVSIAPSLVEMSKVFSIIAVPPSFRDGQMGGQESH